MPKKTDSPAPFDPLARWDAQPPSKRRSWPWVIGGALVAFALVCGALGAGSAHGAGPAATGSGPVTFAVAGDSFSARPGNWTTLPQDADVRMVKNWSISGATSGQVLAAVKPLAVDVLIVEVGNNDVNQHVPWAVMVANTQALAKKVGAQRVLISAVGPSDVTNNGHGINRRDGNQNASKYLASMANNHGWMFVDPFTSLKSWNNAYVPAMVAADHVHPSALGQNNLAKRYDEFVLQAVRGSGAA